MNTTESEFRTLYHSFYPTILRYLTRLVGPEEAEDLTQYCSFSALSHIFSSEERAAAEAGVVRNLSARFVRQRDRDLRRVNGAA
jgi:DNA-directed RNA polymerase specialized sigma24 family protein